MVRSWAAKLWGSRPAAWVAKRLEPRVREDRSHRKNGMGLRLAALGVWCLSVGILGYRVYWTVTAGQVVDWGITAVAGLVAVLVTVGLWRVWRWSDVLMKGDVGRAGEMLRDVRFDDDGVGGVGDLDGDLAGGREGGEFRGQ